MEKDTSTLMIVRKGVIERYPPIFHRFEEQFDYLMLFSPHFNEFVDSARNDTSGRYRVLGVEGDFIIVFSKVLDKLYQNNK